MKKVEYETEWDTTKPFHMSGSDYRFDLGNGITVVIVAGTGTLSVEVDESDG